MAMIVVISGPRSTAISNTVFDCCFTVAIAIAVVGLHSGWCSIINNCLLTRAGSDLMYYNGKHGCLGLLLLSCVVNLRKVTILFLVNLPVCCLSLCS